MKGRGDERSRESARVPKAVHCAIQSKGKESRVLLNYTPSVPLPNSDHQIAGTDIDDDLHGSIWCCTSTKRLSSSVAIRSTKMGKRKGNSSPFPALFISFLQLHTHKV